MVTKNETETEISEEEFNRIINNSHKLVVVDFYNEWCMPCLMMSPIIEDLAEVYSEVKFVKVNNEDNRELAQKLNVSSIPCLIIFKEGKEAGRILGVHSYETIERKLKEFF